MARKIAVKFAAAWILAFSAVPAFARNHNQPEEKPYVLEIVYSARGIALVVQHDYGTEQACLRAKGRLVANLKKGYADIKSENCEPKSE